MKRPPFIFPNDITDETAFALCNFFHELALACESHYYVQLRRYSANHQPDLIDPEQPWRTKPLAK